MVSSTVSNNIASAQYTSNFEQNNNPDVKPSSYSHDDITEHEASIYIDDPNQRYNSQDEPIDNDEQN